jgi:hypothetical protein
VAAVATIVIGTAVAIWAMRPGGIAGRQPRAVALGLVLTVVVIVAGRLLTGPGRRFSNRPLAGWGTAVGIAAGLGVVAGLAWPGGLLLEGDPPPPTLVPDPLELPPPDGGGIVPELGEIEIPDLPDDPADLPPGDDTDPEP